MKTVRIAGTVRQIEETNQHVNLFTIQDVLSEHRTNLISRILNDLPTYLAFKFYMKVDKDMQEILRDRLLELACSRISLDRYSHIVRDIDVNSNYRVPSQEFFREIDAALDSVLNPTQLSLRVAR